MKGPWRFLQARVKIRSRLAMLLAVTFLAGGAALLAAVYVLVAGRIASHIPVQLIVSPGDPRSARPPGAGYSRDQVDRLFGAASDSFMRQLLGSTVIALILLAAVSGLVGWWISGHILQPVTHIAEVASRLSRDNLHERIDLAGPHDEIKRLADAFDTMVGRLQLSFDAQRRFIANASHEIRTPLAIQRAAVELRLRKDYPGDLERVRSQLLDINHRMENLIDGLMTLAESDRGLGPTEPVDLGGLVREAAVRHAGPAAQFDISFTCEADGSTVAGDPVLLGHLIDNLLQNAISHNSPGGWIEVRLTEAVLSVSNTGTVIPESEAEAILEPFHRYLPDRSSKPAGSGLGLSIVSSIARAHGASLTASPRSGGGLTVVLSFNDE